jgi:hypothetical protein
LKIIVITVGQSLVELAEKVRVKYRFAFFHRNFLTVRLCLFILFILRRGVELLPIRGEQGQGDVH